MGGGDGKSRKRRSSPSSGEEEGRERKRRDKKESRRSSRDDREDDGYRHSDRDKCKEGHSKDRHSKEKEKSNRKDKDALESHGGPPCSQLKASALAHQGKATSNVDFNLKNPPSAYSYATVHVRRNEYTSMGRQVHGPEYDPSTPDFDGELVIRVGRGKKHGRGDSTLDTATTPTLSQIRARSTSERSAVRPRLDTAQHRVDLLQAQLDEMRMQRLELEAEQLRMQQEMQAEQLRMQRKIHASMQPEWKMMEQMYLLMQAIGKKMDQPAPPMLLPPPPSLECTLHDMQAWMEAKRQMLEQMYLWCQTIGEKTGRPPPLMLFPPPPPPLMLFPPPPPLECTLNESTSSNDGP